MVSVFVFDSFSVCIWWFQGLYFLTSWFIRWRLCLNVLVISVFVFDGLNVCDVLPAKSMLTTVKAYNCKHLNVVTNCHTDYICPRIVDHRCALITATLCVSADRNMRF